MNHPQKQKSKFATLFFLSLLLVSAGLIIHLLFGFLTPVVLAMVIVSLCRPFYERLKKSLKNRNYLAASISTCLVFLGIIIPLTLFFIVLTQEALNFYNATSQGQSDNFKNIIYSLKEHLNNLRNYLSRFGIIISPNKIIDTGSQFIENLGLFFYNNLSWLAGNLLSLVFNFILTLALVFVFFVSGNSTKDFLVELFPLPKDELDRLTNKFQELTGAVFLGNGLISISEGLLGGLFFFIFGIQGALIWGVCISIASFLPVVGAWVVVAPAAIYLYLMDQTWQASVFFIVNSLSLGVMEMIIKPKIVGTKSQMHSVLVFLSVFAGIQIYGTLGLFYGPLIVTMFLSLAEIYKEHYKWHLFGE